MPELPEVETVRRGIEPIMVGFQITEVKQFRPDLRWPLPLNMPQRLTGTIIKAVRRRSKYIIVDLDSEETLIIHLGMTGRVLISDISSSVENKPETLQQDVMVPGPHDHIIIELEKRTRITYNDVRRFGAMDLTKQSKVDCHPWLLKLGPEPLSNDFSTKKLENLLGGKKTSIKSALMNQQVVAGLGNIYVSEILWHSGISPLALSNSLGIEKVETLKNSIVIILSDAIDKGGSSLKDYRRTNGELGYFQHFFKVYDREGLACFSINCGGKINRIIQSGRSTYYCPRCQVGSDY